MVSRKRKIHGIICYLLRRYLIQESHFKDESYCSIFSIEHNYSVAFIAAVQH